MIAIDARSNRIAPGTASSSTAPGNNNRRALSYERDRRDYHRRQTYRPVYVPPPVVYAPAPSPGISIFFPLFR
jgi:hypothetical protein